ncbi:sensor histidine kinase [Flavobacteriaceae bacterium M23B6Z8]
MLQLLEKSYTNGLALVILSILLYIGVYHIILFLKIRKRYYLYYGLYALLTVAILIGRVDNVFFSSFFDKYILIFSYLHFFNQTLSFLLFAHFIMSLLNFKEYLPSYHRAYYWFTWGALISIVILSIHRIVIDDRTLITQFYFIVFTPLALISTIYGLYLIFKKIKDPIRNIIAAGVIVIMMVSIIFAFLTAGRVPGSSFTYGYIYLFGALLENLLFSYAIATKQYLIQKEKIEIQEKYILKLQENETIKEEANQLLQLELQQQEKSLKKTLAILEKEKLDKLRSDFDQQLYRLHLTSLQNQMNPHFIFNALNSIKVYLIESNKEKAVYYLNKFAKLIRKILEFSRREQISLAEEVVIAELYLQIENIRFLHALDYKINIDSDVPADAIQMPPLILQPFIENSLWHGLAPKEGTKNLDLKISMVNNNAQVLIADNGIGREASKSKAKTITKSKESLGLTFARERIDYYNKKNGTNYSFEIRDLTKEEGGGTAVIFNLNI